MRKRHVKVAGAFLKEGGRAVPKGRKVAFELIWAGPMEAEVKELFLAEMATAGVMTGVGDPQWESVTLGEVVFHAVNHPSTIPPSTSVLANDLELLTQQLQSAERDVTDKLRAARDSHRREADICGQLLGGMPPSPACSRLETLQAEVVSAMRQEGEV